MHEMRIASERYGKTEREKTALFFGCTNTACTGGLLYFYDTTT